MYSRCIRCSRRLGKNDELPHLPEGRRIAFDAVKGRVWVVCERCDQWNLVPIEERWEILGECEALAQTAEVRGAAPRLGAARTSTGLELLRIGGMDDADVATWRYGRKLLQRQRLLWWIAAALMGVAAALGLRAGLAFGSGWIGLYIALLAAVLLAFAWSDPPHLQPLRVAVSGRTIVIWPWRISDIAIGKLSGGRPTIFLPGRAAGGTLRGNDAAQFLARALPAINGADYANTSLGLKITAYDVDIVRDAVDRATDAERASRQLGLRPWEIIAADNAGMLFQHMRLTDRLALEIAATEEVEQRELARNAEHAESMWHEEESIAAIADDLLVPEQIRARIDHIKRATER